jgi:hypothetical protein
MPVTPETAAVGVVILILLTLGGLALYGRSKGTF